MASYRLPGLSEADASRICMQQCRAQCCRGSLILTLKADEVAAFEQQAAERGITLELRQAPDGGSWLRFGDYPRRCCPMLDPNTAACRIYSVRPQRCRDFPERVTPGCAISGG